MLCIRVVQCLCTQCEGELLHLYYLFYFLFILYYSTITFIINIVIITIPILFTHSFYSLRILFFMDYYVLYMKVKSGMKHTDIHDIFLKYN